MIRYASFSLLIAVFFADLSMAREWTDVTGKFKVEAELIEVTDGAVRLQRRDNGKVVTVSIEKLSLADQQHLETLSPLGPAAEWKSYPFPKAGFMIDFPSKPEYIAEKDDEGAVTHSYESGTEGSEVFYTVVIDELEEDADAATAQAILDGIAENLAEITTSKKPIILDGHPGVALLLEFEEDGVELVIQNKIYVVDARIIQVMVASPEAEKASAQLDRFFGSFKLSSPEAEPE